VLFAVLVAASDAVAATTKRTEKVGHLASCLGAMAHDEVAIGAALLSGTVRQGRIGVGWASLANARVPAAEAPSLTLHAVDAAIEALAALGGAGSVALREQVLHGLFAAMTAPEQDFFRRVLGGEVRQGALAAIVTDAVAKAAAVPVAAMRRALMRAGDLPATAVVALVEGEAGLGAIGLEIGRPVLPMLAASSPDVGAALQATGPASVEWKLDGARVQIHRAGDVVRVFTRNLNEVTARLDGVVAVARALPVERVVLDGEAVGFGGGGSDGEDGLEPRPGYFQDTMAAFGSHGDGSGAGLAVRLFDVLHVDGRDLLDEPLSVRRAILDEIAGPWAVPSVITDDPVEAAGALAAALDAGHEGVVVKDLRSPYDAGRRGGSWRKVKPVRTLDLVVLAAEWGYGRRQGWLSNLHLGALDDRPEGEGPPPTRPGYVMVGKTFKGLTDKLLTWQTEAFLQIAEDKGDHVVRLRPELVVEIALDGVQRSTRYPGGVALRFARVRRYRDDKRPEDADPISAVRALLP
jgi:DNA ligase-1